jgi:hypothetical protein
VNSKASSDFWSRFNALPQAVQRQATKQYKLFRENPSHPSLQFKELEPGLYSVRVSRNHRALGWRRRDSILWFWIGTHAEYDRLISQ